MRAHHRHRVQPVGEVVRDHGQRTRPRPTAVVDLEGQPDAHPVEERVRRQSAIADATPTSGLWWWCGLVLRPRAPRASPPTARPRAAPGSRPRRPPSALGTPSTTASDERSNSSGSRSKATRPSITPAANPSTRCSRSPAAQRHHPAEPGGHAPLRRATRTGMAGTLARQTTTVFISAASWPLTLTAMLVDDPGPGARRRGRRRSAPRPRTCSAVLARHRLGTGRGHLGQCGRRPGPVGPQRPSGTASAPTAARSRRTT